MSIIKVKEQENIEQMREKVNLISNEIGDMDQLQTPVNSSLVAALNSINPIPLDNTSNEFYLPYTTNDGADNTMYAFPVPSDTAFFVQIKIVARSQTTFRTYFATLTCGVIHQSPSPTILIDEPIIQEGNYGGGSYKARVEIGSGMHSNKLLVQVTGGVGEDVNWGMHFQYVGVEIPPPSALPDIISQTYTTSDATLQTAVTDTISDDTVTHFNIKIAARDTDSMSDKSFWMEITGAVARQNGGNATLVDVPIDVSGEAGSSGYTASVDVSGNDLLIQVQGGATETVNWVIYYTKVEAI